MDRLDDRTGQTERGVSVSLALTPIQIKKLVAAEERGTLRVVPVK
jgi:hypothetical protein